MPKKIRQLESELAKAGFQRRAGKGSHRKWEHVLGVSFLMSGKPGDDAHRYQEKGVKSALKLVAEKPQEIQTGDEP